MHPPVHREMKESKGTAVRRLKNGAAGDRTLPFARKRRPNSKRRAQAVGPQRESGQSQHFRGTCNPLQAPQHRRFQNDKRR